MSRASAFARPEWAVTQGCVIGGRLDAREIRMRLRLVLLYGPHPAIDYLARVDHGQLREQEAELLVIRFGQLRLYIGRQVPEPLLEGAERLLPRLVEELLVGVAGLALVLRVLPQPIIDLFAQRIGDVVEQHRLEVGSE